MKRKLPPGVSEHYDRAGRLWFRSRGTLNGTRASLGLYSTPEEAAEVYASHLARTADAPKGVTLLAWGEKWLERRATDKVHRATHKNVSCWRTHVATAPFAGWPLRKIQRIDVVRWIKVLLRTKATRAKTTGKGEAKKTTLRELDRTLSRQTILNALNLLRRALNDAADEGLAPVNVAAGVGVPRVARSDEWWTFLTVEELGDLFALPLDPAQRAIYSVAIYSGLRPGELWGLRWSDVVLEGKRPELVVGHSYRGATKSGKPRRVPLLAQAREALEAWRKAKPRIGAALVFPADGGKCHAQGYDAGWQSLKLRAGIDRKVRFYDMRHTCGSHLISGSWSRSWTLREVQELLGHASQTTTERYAHLAPESLHSARAETDAAAERKKGKR